MGVTAGPRIARVGDARPGRDVRISAIRLLRADRRRGLRAGRARLHADLQRVRRHQLRPGRVRDAGRHGDGVPRPSPACRCRSRRCSPISSRSPSGLRCIASRSSPRAAPAPSSLIIITIGASIFLRGAAQVLFDKRFHSLPPLFGGDADPRRRRRHPAAEPGGARRRGRRSSCCSVVLLRPHAARQGDARDRRQPARGAARRHRHPRHRRLSRSRSRPRSARCRHPDHADHAHQLRRRHAAGAQGLRRRHARRHRQPARRGGRRACCSACSRRSPPATSPRTTRTRSRSSSSCSCCSPCRTGLFGRRAVERV